MKTKLKFLELLRDLHIKYNQEIETYEEDGEEDFKEWLKLMGY
ncbi:MAG: hypothetical protein ACTSPU_09370 [Promethearchaeota archaeon]